MHRLAAFVAAAGASLLALTATGAFAAGDPCAGAQAFAACAGCHSLEPERHPGIRATAGGEIPRSIEQVVFEAFPQA